MLRDVEREREGDKEDETNEIGNTKLRRSRRRWKGGKGGEEEDEAHEKEETETEAMNKKKQSSFRAPKRARWKGKVGFESNAMKLLDLVRFM